MEPIDQLSESSIICVDEKIEAMDLLEECWFFENLLNIKPKMSRCYSDPCPSTVFSPDMLVKNSYGSNIVSPSKLPDRNGSVRATLIPVPSMQPCRGKEDQGEGKGSSFTKSELTLQPSSDHVLLKEASQTPFKEMKGVHKIECNSRRRKLLRTPSLPHYIGREETIQQSDPRNGKSTSQASPLHPQILPPRHTSKSCSLPRCRSQRNSEAESNIDRIKETRQRLTTRKSLSELEIEEVQGFKDLGFSFEKEALDPSLVNILPGLQEKNQDEAEEDKAVRKPYLSEAWIVQTCAPPVPNWVSNRSAEDVKAQIKFWARTVASNVHQEC
ncbi:Serine/arginine repetitive matrix protein [Quillaja saponaria]|uniref:Serine/arginine repetitive matrix protein n=1 Tax=Quillaja saponaria TaxID=32244 RepID=A0AAD7KZI8_QUISA|nr:Serine/arginine repetitive matrix protein [Quillaja saponaria]